MHYDMNDSVVARGDAGNGVMKPAAVACSYAVNGALRYFALLMLSTSPTLVEIRHLHK